MINYVTVTNYLGDKLKFDLRNPEESGFLLSGITGITPVKSEINITDITTNDGGLFNSARVGTRNIVLGIIYLPNPTIEQSRYLIYKYFPVKRMVTLEFETDTRKAEITGYVESNEVSIFSQQEASQISIICPDPLFYSTEEDSQIDVNFSGTSPKFAFTFPDKSPVAPDLIFGDIESFREQPVNYTGDAETGLNITIKALGSVGDITIYNRVTNESIQLRSEIIESITQGAIGAGDVIEISTYKGKKTVTLLRSGVRYNIINALGENTVWMQLRKGTNVFAFTATSGATRLVVKLNSRVVYEGL